jgi:hypothetical protein
MLSIQEMVDKTVDQRKEIRRYMDQGKGYHPEEANLYMGQKRSIQREIGESLRRIPLREFLIKSGTADLAGAAYLVPDKLQTILYHAADERDLTKLVSADLITGWEGGALDVDIVERRSMTGGFGWSGGGSATRTPKTEQATITPIFFSCPLVANQNIIEDSNFNLLEWYVREAGRGMAWQSFELALGVLKTCTDGIGTVNTEAAGSDTTTYLDILNSIEAVSRDEWIPNTLIVTPEVWTDAIAYYDEVAGGTAGDYGLQAPFRVKEPAEGFDIKYHMLDTLFSVSPTLHDSADARGAEMTACVSLIFDRRATLFTGRKRWLQVDNYADPVRDLAGAVVSARQDSVSMYDDSMCITTET